MDINTARVAIYNRIVSSGIVTADRIDDGDLNMTGFVMPTEGVWIRPSIKLSSAGVQTLGGPNVATRRRRGGTTIIQVFSSLGVGEWAGDDVADQLLRLFEAQNDAGVFYRSPYVRDIGRDEAWWQKNVIIPFDFDVVCI